VPTKGAYVLFADEYNKNHRMVVFVVFISDKLLTKAVHLSQKLLKVLRQPLRLAHSLLSYPSSVFPVCQIPSYGLDIIAYFVLN